MWPLLAGLAAAAALRPAYGTFVSTEASVSAGDDPGHVHALPSFPQYHHQTEQLDGYWRYAFSSTAFPQAPEPSAQTWVPEALPTTDAAAPPRGFALYERGVRVAPGEFGRLQFYGCAFHCTVQVDGQEVARHSGGYTVFYADVPEGNHTLRVLVDSRLDANGEGGINQPKYDFMQYGGILRPVVLHRVPAPAMVEGVDVVQGGGKTTLRFRLHRFGPARDPLEVEVTSDYLAQPLKLHVDEEHSEHDVDLQGPRWSPEAPNLAVLHVRATLGSFDSGLSVRTGLRRVSACGEEARVCLDDKPVKLLGFCMHNLDAHYRQTVPRESIKRDLDTARAAGANFLRLVHYPHDALTLELADELGILLWTETLGWGNSKRDLTDAGFRSAQVQMLDEAVPTTFNHPSVVLFGFLNEGDDADAAACPVYRDLAARYRSWRVNGLVTWASNTYDHDRCLADADVVSFNTYPGWYSGLDKAPSASVPEEFDRLASWAKRAWPNKPLIIAEVGAAAIPASVPFEVPAGPHARGGDVGHWGEPYQASVDAAAAEAAVCDDRVAGLSIWQLFDTRTGEERQVSRPRGFNNKGVVREDGAPKQSFAAVRDAFTQPCARTVLP